MITTEEYEMMEACLDFISTISDTEKYELNKSKILVRTVDEIMHSIQMHDKKIRQYVLICALFEIFWNIHPVFFVSRPDREDVEKIKLFTQNIREGMDIHPIMDAVDFCDEFSEDMFQEMKLNDLNFKQAQTVYHLLRDALILIHLNLYIIKETIHSRYWYMGLYHRGVIQKKKEFTTYKNYITEFISSIKEKDLIFPFSKHRFRNSIAEVLRLFSYSKFKRYFI